MNKTIKDLAQLIKKPTTKSSPKPYDTTATVKRIEGDTVWVSIPGGVDETPISKTINCSEGDTVQIRVSGGRAWIVGNASAPPTDDKAADHAQATADTAQTTADEAVVIAEEAQSAAQSVNQYFWHTETDNGAGAGAHITEIPQADFLADPTNGGGNLLGQSTGISVRDGLTDLATFGSSGVQIGQNASGESRTEISTAGMQIIQNVSGTDTTIANLGYGLGINQNGTTSYAPFFSFGERQVGYSTGNYSVAEGNDCAATRYASHAEGYGSIASALAAHAQNINTRASMIAQTVIGTNNVADTTPASAVHPNGQKSFGNYAVIIGNGATGSARHNALTVDWVGNVVADGDIEDGNGNVLSSKLGEDANGDVSITNDLSVGGQFSGFFKIVDLAVSVPSVSAHTYNNLGAQTVSSPPSGMTLAGIVGVDSTNYRIVPYRYAVSGTDEISVSIVNTTAAASAAATMTFKLLYVKATSA